VFFYLTYPSKMEEFPEEMAYLRRMPERVTLIPMEMNHLDRVAELHSIPRELRKVLHPIGTLYSDFDIVVTSRIPSLPMFRVLSGRQSGFCKGSLRGFFGLEEMPILSFRKTVGWGNIMELQTLTSYLLSDGIMMNNLWTEKPMGKVASSLLSPSKRKELGELVKEVVPTKLERLKLTKGVYDGKSDFNVGFTGRVTSTRSFDKVAELFRKQFSFPIGKNKKHMKFVISTNSLDFGSHREEDISFVDVQFNKREEFHSMLESLHVCLNLSEVEDFSLSTYETLLMGVPVIVYDRLWNSFLGETYPFRVKTEVECYALLTAFAANYEAQYSKFREWEASHWRGLVESKRNVTTAEALWLKVMAFDTARDAYLNGQGLGGQYREVAKSFGGLTEVNFVNEMAKLGKVTLKDDVNLMRSPTPTVFKLILSGQGFKDVQGFGEMVRKNKCN